MRSGTVRSLVAAAIVATPFSAIAGVLTTPLMVAGGTHHVTCVASNVGTSQAEVTITAQNEHGSTLVPYTNSCAAPLDPGESCDTAYDSGEDAWCAFQVRGRVKAAIHLLDGGTAITSMPATK